MGYPVCILKRAMPFREFLEWCDWVKRYPIDDESQAAYIAQLASLYVNAHLPKNKKQTSLLDFLLFRPSEPISMDEKWRRLLSAMPKSQDDERKPRKRKCK